jgi:hypothetical protein
VIALSPMLGVISYFGPYYLVLPLVGIALIVGKSFEWIYTTTSSFNSKAAVAVICIGLLPFVLNARAIARAELYNSTALGYAGRIAGNSARDLKQAHPTLPPGATVFIINPDQPNLTRFFGISGLVRLVYADDTIDVRYSSLGHTVSDELLHSSKLVVMRYENEGLVPEDPKQALAATSQENLQYDTSSAIALDVFPTQVAAGKGSYTIRLSGMPNADGELQYRFNDGPLAILNIHLNPKGETHFFVSQETKRGNYRFVGFRRIEDSVWVKVDGSITVTD